MRKRSNQLSIIEIKNPAHGGIFYLRNLQGIKFASLP